MPAAIFLNLALGFAACRRRGKGFGHRLALLFVRQAKIRSVTGILGAMAMATGVATAPRGRGDGTGPEVVQLGDLPQQGRFLALQIGDSVGGIRHMGHDRSLLCAERIIYARLHAPKKQIPDLLLLCRTPHGIVDPLDYFPLVYDGITERGRVGTTEGT
jgi:hypothetical protein